jgi:hypothetical protein
MSSTSSESSATREQRLRPLAVVLKASFTISLILSVLLGTIVVLTQLIGVVFGAGGLVAGVAALLTPLAFGLAAYACVSSLLVSYVSDEQPVIED